jgi:hypothetical protein
MDKRRLFSNFFDKMSELMTKSDDSDYFKWLSNEVKLVDTIKFDELDDAFKFYISSHEVDEPKMCFSNSGKIVLDIPDVKYCEGYFIIKDLELPFEHAWVKINGRYYDPTIHDNEDVTYGLVKEYDHDELLVMLLDKQLYGPFLRYSYDYSNSSKSERQES